MKNLLFLFLLCFIGHYSQAQFIKEKSILAQIGYGLSAPNNSATDVVGSGFFAQGELILKVASWVELRPYAGFIITNSDGEDIDGNPTFERVEAKAFLMGGKIRLRAPIPYVAPFAEVGIGTSIGKFETLTAFDFFDKSGIIYHIPFSFGLELGKNHNVELGLTYYFQPSVEQYVGAFAIGLSFPLKG